MAVDKIIQLTEDGSHTIAIPSLNITYHSKYGAVQESMLVFIKEGLAYFTGRNKYYNEPISIFEMGFGTGLNALLSLTYAIMENRKIVYHTIEPYPLTIEESHTLNYIAFTGKELKEEFYLMHECRWDKPIQVHPLFSFQKTRTGLEAFETNQQFHIIYFDAFDPNAQPELWTEVIFKKMYRLLYTDGILVTYCSKSSVQKAMKAAGFSIEKLKGPPHKREIIRATKN